MTHPSPSDPGSASTHDANSATSPAARHKPADAPHAGRKLGIPRRLGLTGTLFIVGLLLGLLFFLSREILWSQVLNHTLGRLPQATWSWGQVRDQGLTRITYADFELRVDDTLLFFPELTIQVGAKPPVTMVGTTGPSLRAVLDWDKNLRFSGGADLQHLLPEQGLQGLAETDGMVRWQDWNQPPEQGRMNLHAPGLLMIAPGVMTTNLRVEAMLEGDRLILAPIQADGPIALSAEAEVLLDWNRLENSTYSLTGTLIGMGDMPFSTSGRLGGLWGK
jgi:hypothetical protein